MTGVGSGTDIGPLFAASALVSSSAKGFSVASYKPSLATKKLALARAVFIAVLAGTNCVVGDLQKTNPPSSGSLLTV